MAIKIRRRPTKVKARSQLFQAAAIEVNQGTKSFYLLSIKASQLWRLASINRREEGGTEGYQRVISGARVRSITKYIQSNRTIPGAIVVSFDDAEFDDASGILTVYGSDQSGWIIDGQHRAAGAYQASQDGEDIDLAVVAYLNADTQDQIELFITINREAKGVPASLYLDLLKDLPRKKSDKEILDERITDIPHRLNQDEESPFSGRVIFTRTARAGEISVVNFARIMRLHLSRNATLGIYTQIQQEGAINNYYSALLKAFPSADKKDIFFRTVGFGAVWRAFPLVFSTTQARYKSFSVVSILKVLKEIDDFNFDGWSQYGSGSAAEVSAGDDLVAAIQEALEGDAETSLKLS